MTDPFPRCLKLLVLALAVASPAAAARADGPPPAGFTLTATQPCQAGSCEPRIAYDTTLVPGGLLVEVDWDVPGGDSARFEADDAAPCGQSDLPAGADLPECALYGPPYDTAGRKLVAVRVTAADGQQAMAVQPLIVDALKRRRHRATASDPCPPYQRGVHCGPGNNRRTAGGGGKVSHRGWPAVSGMFWIVQDRHGHKVTGIRLNDELLGGHGSDTISGGGGKDIIWGDYHPCCQPAGQHDILRGGGGPDWIYSSHGHNDIWTGTGADHVFIHWGHGTVHCGSPRALVRGRPRHPNYRLIGCKRVGVW